MNKKLSGRKQWLWFILLYAAGVSIAFGISLIGRYLLSFAH